MKSSTPTARRSIHAARRSTWTAALGALAAGVLALGTACTDEQRRSLGEEDVRTSLAAQVGAAVESAGLALDGDLDCHAAIDVVGNVTAGCTGTTETGDAVSGAYNGTGDVDAETCTAHMVTTIADERVSDEPDVECFEAG